MPLGVRSPLRAAEYNLDHTNIAHVTHCLTENITETGLEPRGDHKCSLCPLLLVTFLFPRVRAGSRVIGSGSEGAQSSPSAHQAAAVPAARSIHISKQLWKKVSRQGCVGGFLPASTSS